jgi:hypothetical protein
MKSGFLSIGGLSIIACAMIVSGAEVYVSPTGNDAAAGTITAPLKTITAARDKADQLKAGNTQVKVYLRGGTYYLTAPVVFGSANSGTAQAPIIYTAYGLEKPVISGGILVPSTAVWTASGNKMVTTIATGLKVDQLFLNGKRQVLARYPNFNASQRLEGYDGNCLSRVGTWATPGEGPGYVRGLHSGEWGGNSYIITGKSGTTLQQTWVGDNNRGNGLHTTYRMVENIYEELDAAGEWFYRKSTGQLFFYPPAGTNLATAVIELASQDELFRFVGSAANTAGSVKYIQFKGITFTHTYRTLFSKTYEPIFQSDWGIARAGTIFMQNAENITISHCLFDQVGGNGIFVSGYNRSHLIYNNVFNDAGASCVALLGLRSSVRCPNSYSNAGSCTDKTPGPVDPVNGEFPEFVTVSNNMMSRLGRFEKQPAGIALSATQCDTLRHNTIHDCPRAGICYLDGSWGGHVVDYNWVYNAIQETGDHGPFNAWGRDRVQRWQSDPTASKLDAWKTTYVRNNRFEAPSQYFGIDMDDQACNYYQENNLLFGGGLKLQWNRDNTYLNNILVNGASAQFHGVWTQSHHYGARNILVGSYIYQQCCFSGDVPSAVKAAITQWDSNCVYNNGSNPYVAPWMGTNQQYSWAQWTGAGLDKNTKVADPMFTDVNKTWPNYLPKGDYTVRAGSPALTLGFKNFPMDSFGVMPVAYPPDPPVSVSRTVRVTPDSRFDVRYIAGRLIVAEPESYTITLTNALGRAVEVFAGKGDASFDLAGKGIGKGVYYAVVRTQNAKRTVKLLID